MVRAFGKAPWLRQSQVPECSEIDLHVLRHLINSCGVPGWTGTREGHHHERSRDQYRQQHCSSRHQNGHPGTRRWRPRFPCRFCPDGQSADDRSLEQDGIQANIPTCVVQQISPAATPHRSARRQSTRAQRASPPCPDAHATGSYAAAKRTAAKHCRSRRRAGRSVSLATWHRKAAFRNPPSRWLPAHSPQRVKRSK
jgi:hypothetical protein